MPWQTITATALVIAGLLQIYFAWQTSKRIRERQNDPDRPALPKTRFFSSPAGGFMVGTILSAIGLYSLLN